MSYIRRLGSFFLFKILNFSIFLVFRKMNIFGGMPILWILFGGHRFMFISIYYLGSFLKVNIQNWDIFGGGCKSFK